MVGRQLDVVWRCYHRQRIPGGYQGCCLGCGQMVTGLTYRLKRHADGCKPLKTLGLWTLSVATRPQGQAQLKFPSTPKERVVQLVARTIFANNMPFTSIGNKDFKALINTLAPNVKLPCARTLGNSLLDSEYELQRRNVRAKLQDEWVTVSGDSLSFSCSSPLFSFQLTPGAH